jgi:predicted Zn-dependent peptidase
LSGLSENFEEAFALMQEVLLTPKLTDEAFKGVVDKMVKNMTDAKASQNSVLNALRSYGEYGPALIAYSLKPDELTQLKGEEIVDLYATLTAYPFEVFYYGPLKHKQLINFLKKKIASKGEGVSGTETQERVFKNKEVVENQVLFIPYDAKQSRLVTYTRGPLFDSKLLPIITMYNAYFGGGMSAIVFQEMREKRSLAYTAQSAYIAPAEKDEYMYNYSFIGTQNDKVTEAWEAFNTLFNEMPLSEATFKLAQESVKNDISNTRYTKRGLLSFYIRNRERGFDYDYRRNIWNAGDGFTLQDVADFNKKYVQNQPKTYMILAREGEIDLKLLEEKFGQVVKLSLKDIFGF